MNMKVVLGVVVVFLLLPLVLVLWPKPLTIERVQKAFEEQGFTLTNFVEAQQPSLESVRQFSLTINGAPVEVYQYDDEGKIAVQLAYQQPDPGSLMVESMGLAQSLGAAPPSPIKTDATRNGKWMITVSSESAELRARVIRTFKAI